LISLWEVPWCIGGDFNVTLFLDERLRGAVHRSAVTNFADFVVEQGLMDLLMAGGDSTWSNNVSWSRLDRFLVSPEWEFNYRALCRRNCSGCAQIMHLFFLLVAARSLVRELFTEFHDRGEFVKSINSSFIALIPKIHGAKEIKEFRPISLVGGIYKITAKALANRMRRIMDKVISKPQNAFVKGRQILDLVFIANECLDSRIKSRDPGVLCKLDMEKAYDHVDWTFLLYLLKRCGFGERWCSWIKHCISTDWFSILINGSLSGFFGSLRGARQGDPLSPFLFVLVMEAFSRMISAIYSRGLISGFSVGSREHDRVEVSHLLFVDDTLVFCGVDASQISYMGALLVCFEAVLGLKVNLTKLVLVLVGSLEDVNQLADRLGCGTTNLPLKYLGLPLGASFKLKATWKDLEDLMARRLAHWKCLYLSKGGRVVLIKSTLSNMLTYLLSLFPILANVAKLIEKLQRDFLWGGLNDEAKLHLVDWDTVCSPITEGGSGIQNLRKFNQALLGK
jgi:hypothetical protein